MSNRAYRLIALHQKIDGAILREMRRRVPSRLQLLRLRAMRVELKQRLNALLTPKTATA